MIFVFLIQFNPLIQNMLFLKRLYSPLLPLSGLLAAAIPASAAYDFFICANVNRDYVIGSNIVTLNGTFKLTESGDWEHFGDNDLSIFSLAFDPRDRDRMYTATLNGMFHTENGGETWRMANSWDMTEGNTVVVDPNEPDTVYLGTTDGIAVSRDRGYTLERRENGIQERGRFTQVIQVDRTTAGRVLAGTASGIYLTEDRGEVWHRVLPTATTVNDVRQSPHDPDRWVAVTDTHGAWESNDRGLNWKRIEGLPREEAIYNITFDITNPDRLAIGSWSYGVWVSEDGGQTWEARNEGLPDRHRVWRTGIHPNSGRLYVSVFQSSVFVSDDFGRSWEMDPYLEDGSLVRYFLSVPR